MKVYENRLHLFALSYTLNDVFHASIPNLSAENKTSKLLFHVQAHMLQLEWVTKPIIQELRTLNVNFITPQIKIKSV